MTDSAPNNDASTNPTGGSDASIDVDALLKDVADLTADVRREVGADIFTTVPTEDSPADVESQLDRLDQLVEETANDLGHVTDPEMPTDEAPSPDPTTPPPNDAPPDTVDDEPADDQAPPTDPQADAESPAADPPSSADYLADESEAKDEPKQLQTETPPAPSPKFRRIKSLASGMTRRASVLLLGGLDSMDRPFTFVGYQIRIVLGWVAVVTLLAAICVLVISR